MVMEYYIGLVLLVVTLIVLAKKSRVIYAATLLFFALQGAGIGYLACEADTFSQWGFFEFDTMALTYAALMSGVGLLTIWRSITTQRDDSLRHKKIYYLSLVALSASLVGVYSSSNIAVNWIFLEATTLASAGLVYHRRSVSAVEAAWKYIFICSIGIAVAYLGILLLSTTGVEALSYSELREAVALPESNPIYLRLAFLFILIGYSTKLEIFPLFTIGIDANHSAPAPSSAFISSALVGGGFVSLFRLYGVMSESSEGEWMMNILLLVAVISLICSAVYMGRTGNYKRMLAYSTVENSGLALLGLALGGAGVFAAVLHSLSHTVIKAVAFLQLSKVGRLYGTYRTGRISGYMKADRLGAMVMLMCVVSLVAAPPSLLFRSEYIMFSEILRSPKWWIVFVVVLPLLICAYWALTKLLAIIFGDDHGHAPEPQRMSIYSGVLLTLLLGLFVLCLVNTQWVNNLITSIIV